MNEKALLVISFYFPPFARVGGRRWAKHLKFLNEDFKDFYVLAGDFQEKGTQWMSDIKSFSDRITRVPVEIKYPYYKRTLPSNPLQKIAWKFSQLKWSLISKNKGPEFWDDSYGYEKVFLEKASEIIQTKRTTTLLLSVGPFEIANIIPSLKKKFPHLYIVLDYRDYWNDPNTGADQMNTKLTQREKEVLQYVDAVMSVNQEMAIHFGKRLQKHAILLPHCVDTSDFRAIPAIKDNSDATTWVYGGALYAGMDKQLRNFTSFLDLITRDKPITAEIYAAQKGYENILTKKNILLTKQIPLADFYERVAQAKYLLLFRPDWSPNAFSSKFFELLHFRKPILYFGPDGEVAEFIKKNNLGIHIHSDNLQESGQILNEGTFTFNNSYELDQHEFRNYNTLLMNELKLG